VSRPAVGPAWPSIQWVPVALSPGVKWPGLEAEFLPPSNAKVKDARRDTSTPQYVSMAWCLIKQWMHLYGVVLS
jgi:hypothetical protein